MKILQVNTRYIGGGGAAAIANLLHNSINKNKGMSSRFLYGRGQSDDIDSIKIGYEVESYLSAGAMRVIGKELNRGLSDEVKREIDDADIIHLHNIHGYYINYESLIDYIVKKNKRVIWTLHDTWAFTGRCAFTFGCEKWKCGCGDCNNLNIYPSTKRDISDKLWIKKNNIFNKLNKDITTIVTPSEWLKELLEESYLKNFKIDVINNGVEKSKFVNVDKSELREELGIPIDKKVVLFVAADPNDERKGIKYIVQMFNKFNDDVIFVSMGKKINIEHNRLMQLGYKTNRDEIYKVYRSSDVFVIPSLDDNFPTTVLEAFANGVPVVGFDSGGIKEQVINGVNGYVVNKNNSNDLYEKIRIVFNNSENKNISNNSLNRFKELYSLENFKNRYFDLYYSLYNKEV
ncbi:MAG: glycosyltransferase [Clostridium sp.]|uniref:glycosyltransferase n=1 Tax=Clostridium sp. TaxID=1506 RepID=UPI00290F57C1|nr:glycosyltransferase [Clostridium sp.]MDU5110363.1 glycosyltransferase [Clostridium sp.]